MAFNFRLSTNKKDKWNLCFIPQTQACFLYCPNTGEYRGEGDVDLWKKYCSKRSNTITEHNDLSGLVLPTYKYVRKEQTTINYNDDTLTFSWGYRKFKIKLPEDFDKRRLLIDEEIYNVISLAIRVGTRVYILPVSVYRDKSTINGNLFFVKYEWSKIDPTDWL